MMLVTKWFGAFLCDGRRVVEHRLLPRDPDALASKLAEMQRGGVLPEEKELAEGRERLSVAERRQFTLGKPGMFDSSFIRPEDYGFDQALMREAMIRLAKLRNSEPIPRDRSLVQAIRSLDDVIETANLMSERLHEWYGMHFPELGDLARDRRYAELISKHGHRDAILEDLGLDIESIGADFSDGDMAAVRGLATTLVGLYDDRDRTEAYVSEIVDGICPNVNALVGGPIAARLISLAGGLDRLATLPASTVQMLGAEKAMFRHLKSGKRPPKHGIIYQHPEVHRSPRWQRGKISRALACKISIASRIDAYGGEFRGDKLNGEFMARVREIAEKYPDPPKRPARGKRKKGPGRR